MSDEAGKETGSDTAGAAARIRETAKWLTVTLAALGGVLIAGTQFSSMGSLVWGTPRLTLAVWGGALAAAGSMLVLWGTVRVAVSPALTLTVLASAHPPPGTKPIVTDSYLLDKRESVAKLAAEYGEAVTSLKKTMGDYLKDPVEANRIPAKADEINVRYLAKVVQNLLSAASYAALSYRWKSSLGIIIGGGAVAIAGTFMFVWAANPPDTVKASQASPVILTAPNVGQVVLSSAGRQAVTAQIGADCANKAVLNVLILDETEAGPDILVQEDGCSTVRLILVNSWGSLNE